MKSHLLIVCEMDEYFVHFVFNVNNIVDGIYEFIYRF